MAAADLTIRRGDAYAGGRRLVITARSAAGTLRDLTGITLKFMVKRHRNDADAGALISKATGGQGITAASPQSGGTLGLAYVAINAADTANGPVGRFYAELASTDSDGAWTLWSGSIDIVADLIQGA